MRRLLGGLAAGLLLVSAPVTARAAAPHDPAFDVPASSLAAALRCPARFSRAGEPVLLVHGTGLTPQESWAWNYQKLLPPAGHDECTVELPGRAMGDIQTSAEYVAYAVEAMARRTHRRIAVLTHSQGGLEARWALRWWPSVRAAVGDLILLASPNHGIVAANLCADSGNCWPSVWQMAAGSHFLAALNRVELPRGVAVTNLYSRTDELVEPSTTVPLAGPGVSNIAVQDLCPRVVHHAGMLDDGVVYALVLDALAHPGPAKAARLPATVCLQPFAPGLSPADVAGGNAILYFDAATQGFAGTPGAGSEPPLKPYARG